MIDDIQTIFYFVVGSLWQVWPAFLLSVVLGVLIRMLQLDGVIRRVFEARVGIAILLSTLVGAFSPFCSCTVVPVVSGLLLSGVPLAPVMAFWIASPTMDPEIFALSVATIGWPMAFMRLIATFILSLAAGYLTLTLTRSGWLNSSMLHKSSPVQPCSEVATPTFNTTQHRHEVQPIIMQSAIGSSGGGSSSCTVAPMTNTTADSWQNVLQQSFRTMNWSLFGRDVVAQSWLLGRWLVLAFVLEALITLYVPQTLIAGVLGMNSPLAIPLATLIGVPLYLSNISALPIVAGLLEQGMQPGAGIAFLVAGPVTTIPAMAAVWGIVQRRVFVVYLGIGLIGAAVLGWLSNLFFILL
ncbi:MAG: permease [Chloroflexota bacterium]